MQGLEGCGRGVSGGCSSWKGNGDGNFGQGARELGDSGPADGFLLWLGCVVIILVVRISWDFGLRGFNSRYGCAGWRANSRAEVQPSARLRAAIAAAAEQLVVAGAVGPVAIAILTRGRMQPRSRPEQLLFLLGPPAAPAAAAEAIGGCRGWRAAAAEQLVVAGS